MPGLVYTRAIPLIGSSFRRGTYVAAVFSSRSAGFPELASPNSLARQLWVYTKRHEL